MGFSCALSCVLFVNSAGYEEGPKSAFNMVADAVTDWDWEYDGMILLINVTWDDRNYGNSR